MEVRDGQQFRLALLDPFAAGNRLTLRAVAIAAGVVSNALVLAVAAAFDVAAEDGGPAYLDGTHYAKMRQRQAILRPISRTSLTKDVGQPKAWP
jgi:hypothetical protein